MTAKHFIEIRQCFFDGSGADRKRLCSVAVRRDDRHVTAEMLFHEAIEANIKLSIATVYNTPNQFTQAGLLRRIMPDSLKSFFDIDTSKHPHFYLIGEDNLINIPEWPLLAQMPEALPASRLPSSTSSSAVAVGRWTYVALGLRHCRIYDWFSRCPETL
ncbi:transcriptional repressor [Bradyrhizobium sp. CCGB01]|uniref:transcriptional repressor n=1 Tax=Bradyrhizobium sp. CCGB01 TaxID=2949634 RepID=UPI0028127D66|nr:transcriptional repressor [Bradyrhizobium sp. CCGB01]